MAENAVAVNTPAAVVTAANQTTIDSNHPYFLHSSDAPGMALVNTPFDGRGYQGWKRTILIALSAKNKLGFISGAHVAPDSKEADYQPWSRCNDMVTSWLLNSLSKDIADSVIYSSSAKELWTSLEHRFGQSNGAKIFHLGSVDQYMQTPCVDHFYAALRVLNYLRNDPGQGIFMSSHPSFHLQAFCDADWASCRESRKSVSGFFINLGGSPISWKSKKQDSISLSSAESEYRSMRRLVTELTWLTRLLSDLSVPPKLPIPIHSDSQAAIHIARNPVFHERTKHVELDCHFVRQQYLSGLISLTFVPSKDQLADLFTKSLSGPSHHLILSKLGISSSPSNLRGDVKNKNKIDPDQFQRNCEEEEKGKRVITSTKEPKYIKRIGPGPSQLQPSQ